MIIDIVTTAILTFAALGICVTLAGIIIFLFRKRLRSLHSIMQTISGRKVKFADEPPNLKNLKEIVDRMTLEERLSILQFLMARDVRAVVLIDDRHFSIESILPNTHETIGGLE